MSEYRLEMRDVSKSFPGVKALDKAQLKLRPGTVHALMGENGAGKSTLMKCMFGIYKMDEGEIIYEGQKVAIHDPLQALKLGIAMVHQELQPIPERSVAENIYVGRYPLKRLLGFIPLVDHEAIYENTRRLLQKVRMDFDPKQKLGSLSVSQMQSVEIAKAVSADCKVLILDEPTTAQDHRGRYQLAEIGRRIRDEGGRTILMITHDMDLIAHYAERLIVMWNGTIILDAPTEEAFGQAEILARTFLRPPVAAQVASDLRDLGVPENIVTLPALLRSLRKKSE